MEIPLYQLDSFSGETFGGNPAAVCPLSDWLPDSTMQAIAAENNVSETAFFVPRNGADAASFDLRWFTPGMEVDLCGHATLASAHVIFNTMEPAANTLVFHTRSGLLEVERRNGLLYMDLPAQPPVPKDIGDVAGALGAKPATVLAAVDGVAVFDTQHDVQALTPEMARIAELDGRGLIATAPGDDEAVDFVCRFFAPAAGIPEDPVTGSAFCALVPYWAERLGKTRMFARQISARGGEIDCEHRGDRVRIAGRVAPYLHGTITL